MLQTPLTQIEASTNHASPACPHGPRTSDSARKTAKHEGYSRFSPLTSAITYELSVHAPRIGSCTEVRESDISAGLDVLQPDLPTRDELCVVLPANLDLPELLGPPLVDGDGFDIESTALVRAQEVGRVGDADRLLAPVLDRFLGAGRRERLDDRRVEPPVDETPGLVVTFICGDRTANRRRGDLVKRDVEQLHEHRRGGEIRHHVLLGSRRVLRQNPP